MVNVGMIPSFVKEILYYLYHNVNVCKCLGAQIVGSAYVGEGGFRIRKYLIYLIFRVIVQNVDDLIFATIFHVV